MKPINLVIKAFGSYKNEVEIDFSQIEKHQLFVISGPTGAGKTTIFDAICFALYGSASGSDRENNEMLRSNYADDDVHTRVDFTFTLKGKTYYIYRQLGHIRKGNKTKTGDKYGFYEIDGDQQISCVERQIVSEIDIAVVNLIGLTEKQFKQIVMLPQGEFRKLLISETKNKEEILRSLFETEKYNQLNNILNEKRKVKEKDYAQFEMGLKQVYEDFKSILSDHPHLSVIKLLEADYVLIEDVRMALDKDLELLTDSIKKLENDLIAKRKVHKEKQADLTAKQQVNEQFVTLAKHEEKLDVLNDAAKYWQEIKAQIEQAEKIKALKPYEKVLQDAKTNQKQNNVKVEAIKDDIKSAKDSYDNAEKQYKIAEGQSDLRQEMQIKLNDYTRWLPTVEKADESVKTIHALKQKETRQSQDIKRFEANIEVLRKAKAGHQSFIEKNEATLTEPGSLNAKRDLARDKIRILMEHEGLVTDLNKAIQAIGEKEKLYQTELNKFNAFEQAWHDAQAHQLASKLVSGEACPVCGSTHHPQKAEPADGEELSQERRQVFAKRRDEAYQVFAKVETEVTSLRKQVQAKRNEFEQYGLPLEDIPAQIEAIKTYGLNLKAKIEDEERLIKEIKSHKTQLAQVEKDLDNEINGLNQANTFYNQLKAKLITLETTYETEIKTIPEDLRAKDVLKNQIEKIKRESQGLEKSWDQAQKVFQAAGQNLRDLENNLKFYQSQQKEINKKVETSEGEFLRELEKSGIASVEIFYQNRLPDEEIEDMKSQLDTYEKEVQTIKATLAHLKHELKDKEKTDLEELEENVKQAEALADQAFTNHQKEAEIKSQLMKKMSVFEERAASLSSLEKELAMLKHVYQVMHGDNPKKISFERFIQIDYLEMIIQAANMRFKTLSEGKYILVRSEELEMRGKQSGLSIDVYDSHTGMTRDVKTLSGGEKFLASLCLALGLSDVIQSFQGGISIDMMFIDEGFGTLDEDALSNAIKVLAQLKESGRYIGVISHVEELKTAFPALLQVSKNQEGISSAQFILK